MNEKELLEQWFSRARLNQHAHGECYKYYNLWNIVLSTTVLVLNTAMGSSALFLLSLKNNNSDFSTIIFLMGVFGILIAVLSTLNTFFKLGEIAERHRISCVKYGQLRREIEALICDNAVNLSSIKEKLDSLGTESPVVASSIFNKTKNKLSQ